MLDAALGLAGRGFKVFPIKAGEKKPPLIEEWQLRATADAAQVRSWWTQWPQANIGIHCDGLLVLDVDPKNDGFASLAELEKEVELYETLEVATPSGGRHIYYRCAEPLRNSAGVLGKGLDTRSAGGYVLAPGSRTAAGGYSVHVPARLEDAPAALVARLSQQQTAPRDLVGAERPAIVDTDEAGAVLRAIDFLLTHPVATSGQGGDHHTFRTICRLRDFGVPQTRVVDALTDWNARCVPPWEDAELETKIHNAYEYAQDAPGKLTPEAMGFQDVTAQKPSTIAPEISTVGLLHPADVDPADVLKIAYHVKGVLECQSDAVLFGTWNVGKTFVVLDMGASIATGTAWFGRRVRQGRVLYVGYEGIRALRKRMWALREKYPGLKNSKTPFRYHAMTDPLTIKTGCDELGAALVEFAQIHGGPPDLVIIDTLAAALGGDDSDANKMSELNRLIKTLIKRQKCTVVRVHHTGHGSQERARGHSMLPAGIDTEIRVDKQEIALTKQRDDVRSKVYYKLNVVTVGTDTDGDPVTTCVVEQIENNPMSPELTAPQRECLDRLVALRGDGGFASSTDMRDAMPEDTSPAKRREMIASLERKQYLRAEGKGHVICERGPMAMFD